ncbi:hypothetical protein GCM10023224_05150 [Streptomonospora halophila]|uniref:Uncharacterized protein n=1 Tax=Streptomonospora halophila TaxID=427369 RepID=A0ABP9GBV7_9ACTN
MAGPSKDEREKAASKGKAMPDKEGSGGRFPVRNRGDLQKAIKAVGRAKGGEEGRRKVRRFIIKRARELGLSNMIPDSWSSDGSASE